MKQLPIGVSDFRDLIVGNYYFIDKSAFKLVAQELIDVYKEIDKK